MPLSGGTPRPKARSAHEGISPTGAVYRRSSRRSSASISAPLAAFFLFAVLGSLHGAFICAYLEISNLTEGGVDLQLSPIIMHGVMCAFFYMHTWSLFSRS